MKKEKVLAEINDYYEDELEKALEIMYRLQEAELKYNVKLPKSLQDDIYEFTDEFKYRYPDSVEAKKDVREEMIGKIYIYQGKNELYKGQKVEVIAIHENDARSVIVCDCETTERFMDAKLSELQNI